MSAASGGGRPAIGRRRSARRRPTEPAGRPGARPDTTDVAPASTMLITQVLGGGTGRHIQELFSREPLSRRRPDVIVLEQGPEAAPAGTTLTRMPNFRSLGPYPIGQMRSFRRLWRLVSRARPTLIHTYFFWPILFGRLLKATGRTRYLVENREDEGFNWGRHEYALLRATRSLPDRVICVSEAVRRAVVERERLDPDRVRVIHNGVRMPADPGRRAAVAFRRQLGIDPEAPVVGMVANVERPVKGFRYLVEAAPLILREVPETKFLLVGSGHEASPERARLSESGLDSAFLFTGFRDDVAPYYRTMDVSVLTSLSEGLSITLLESMAHALPVVVTSVGGNPEVVVEGETGFLVPPRDADRFAARVVRLLRDPDLREAMGRAARRRAEEEFALEGVAARYEAVYRESTAARRSDARVSAGRPRPDEAGRT